MYRFSTNHIMIRGVVTSLSLTIKNAQKTESHRQKPYENQMLMSKSWTLLGGAVELLPPEAVQGGVGDAHELPLVDVDDLKVGCLAAKRSHLMMRLWCTVPSRYLVSKWKCSCLTKLSAFSFCRQNIYCRLVNRIQICTVRPLLILQGRLWRLCRLWSWSAFAEKKNLH